MAGKHRKAHRRKPSGQRYWASTLAAAAVGATSLTTALSTGTTVAVSPAVQLAALITPANSTAQFFASSDYYNQDWVGMYGQPQVVPFLLGPQGIANAIHNSDNDPQSGIAVLASGWGAGQTGTALTVLKSRNDSALDDIDLVVLDNNSNRPAGGFWTTYSAFAPLLFTSAAPSPDDTGIPALDVAYEYNVNSAAPTYPVNLLADVNTLVAYIWDYGGQTPAPVPQYAIDEAKDQSPTAEHYHYILNEDGTQAEPPILLKGSTTTYVTFKSDRLPLVKPLLLIPGGEIVADLVEPALTVLVNAGYKDNDPLPDNPRETRPAGLLPVSETATALQELPDAVQQGVKKASEDLTALSGSSVTNTLASKRDSQRLSTASKPATSPTGAVGVSNRFKPPRENQPHSSSPANTNRPIRQMRHNVRAALDDVADSLTKGAQRFSNTDTPSESSQSPAAARAPKKAKPPATRP